MCLSDPGACVLDPESPFPLMFHEHDTPVGEAAPSAQGGFAGERFAAPPDDMFDAAPPPPSDARPSSGGPDFGGDAGGGLELGPTPGSDDGGLADLAPLPTPGDSLGCALYPAGGFISVVRLLHFFIVRGAVVLVSLAGLRQVRRLTGQPGAAASARRQPGVRRVSA